MFGILPPILATSIYVGVVASVFTHRTLIFIQSIVYVFFLDIDPVTKL